MFFTGKINSLVSQIDEFLDVVAEGGLIFPLALASYLKGDIKAFEERIEQIEKLEARADKISLEVETSLYSRSLLPESRGDVLGLLENTDDVIDSIKSVLNLFLQERPEIPAQFHEGFLELGEACTKATQALVIAIRYFFKDVQAVHDQLHLVYFHEREADRISDKIKKALFASDMEKVEKIHLRYFTLNVEKVSDLAESVAKRLNISAIKRMV